MNFYLQKYGFIPPQIKSHPDPDIGTIVVIPCFNEPDLVSSVASLAACIPPHKKTEIIVVINAGAHHSNEIKAQNKKSETELHTWLKDQSWSWLAVHTIFMDNLPEKHAGVGLARKTGMDEAVARFAKIGYDGIIACFDADCSCDTNYLLALENHFDQNPKSPGCSVYFEHPITGDAHETQIYDAIVQYELHLRYYNQALRFCKLPYAYHTIGSSMAVRSSAYQKQGGMNKRKAGEDFYFLHKIIALGNFTELNETCVYPSPRISNRVPFGTGKAVGDFISNETLVFCTYHFHSFELIQEWVSNIPQLYQGDLKAIKWSAKNEIASAVLFDFLKQESFEPALEEIRKNVSNPAQFVKRFFIWFDAFRVLKLVHYLRDHLYQNQEIGAACQSLFPQVSIYNHLEFLKYLRQLERGLGG